MGMLTTLDNPHNPYTNYREWYSYDMMLGYNTPQRLARIHVDDTTSNDMTLEQAQMELCRQDPLEITVIVTPETFDLIVNPQEKSNS